MNSNDHIDSRTAEARKPAPNPIPPDVPGSSVPKAFFLKTEREMEASIQRGRKSSRSSVVPPDVAKDVPEEDNQYGVQSLEETLSSLPSVENVSRTDSISTDRSSDANTPAKRKRKAGNRVHPSIR